MWLKIIKVKGKCWYNELKNDNGRIIGKVKMKNNFFLKIKFIGYYGCYGDYVKNEDESY